MAKILKDEWFAIATDEKGLLWSSRVMSKKMLYDAYWALFGSCGSQRDCVTKGMLIRL